MPNVEVQQHGVQTRLKKKQRGFYTDPSPGFAALNESHAKASGAAGEKKIAADAGVLAALEKFGLLQRKDGDDGPDAVRVLSDMFKYEDFGLPVKGDPTKGRPAPKDRAWGPASPSGSAGGAMESSSAYRPDTAMAYHGA
jgi:hypothetical protein